MIRVIAELAISRAAVHQLGKATTAPTTSQITTAAATDRPAAEWAVTSPTWCRARLLHRRAGSCLPREPTIPARQGWGPGQRRPAKGRRRAVTVRARSAGGRSPAQHPLRPVGEPVGERGRLAGRAAGRRAAFLSAGSADRATAGGTAGGTARWPTPGSTGSLGTAIDGACTGRRVAGPFPTWAAGQERSSPR